MMNDEEILDLGNLQPRTVRIKSGETWYILREVDAAANVAYDLAIRGAMRFGPDGKVSEFLGNGNAKIALVANSIYREGSETPLGESVVRKWRPEAISTLYEKLCSISPSFNKEVSEEAAKKSSASTEDTSDSLIDSGSA